MASDYGVKICLEPHGPFTDTIEGLKAIMDLLGNIDSIGVNMDTGNSWLGGSDPVALAKAFKDRGCPKSLKNLFGQLP
jgi:inosose dehydratase